MTYSDRVFLEELRVYAMSGSPWNVFIGPYSLAGQEGVALNLLTQDEFDNGQVDLEVQAHIRLPVGSGVPAVLDESERLRVAFVALRQTYMQTVHIAGAWRARVSPVLFDSSGRPERFDTYRFISDRGAVG